MGVTAIRMFYRLECIGQARLLTRPDVRQTEIGAMQVSNRYLADLVRISRPESRDVKYLNRNWDCVRDEVRRKREELEALIPDDDPIRVGIDLLSPFGDSADELTHTRALAFLLDPNAAHGLGRSFLHAIVLKTGQVNRRAEERVRKIIKAINDPDARISVWPEYRFVVEGSRQRSIGRCDLLAIVESKDSAVFVVIENKINAAESVGQLGWYEKEVDKLSRAHPKANVISLFLFVTMSGEAPQTATRQWECLSWLNVASVLRSQWSEATSAVGREWLKLYVATVATKVCGLNLRALNLVSIKDLTEYIRGDANG